MRVPKQTEKLFENKKATEIGGFYFCCSPSWTRTKDPLINSQML